MMGSDFKKLFKGRIFTYLFCVFFSFFCISGFFHFKDVFEKKTFESDQRIVIKPFENILSGVVDNDENLYSDNFRLAYSRLQDFEAESLREILLSEKSIFLLKEKAPQYARQYSLCNDSLFGIFTEQTLLSTVPYVQCLSNYATINSLQQ